MTDQVETAHTHLSLFMDEQGEFDIVKIKMSQPRHRLAAVLGELRCADKLMIAWAACSSDYFECEYEVFFPNGFKLNGVYSYWKKTKVRPSLSNEIRRVLLGTTLIAHCEPSKEENYRRLEDSAISRPAAMMAITTNGAGGLP